MYKSIYSDSYRQTMVRPGRRTADLPIPRSQPPKHSLCTAAKRLRRAAVIGGLPSVPFASFCFPDSPALSKESSSGEFGVRGRLNGNGGHTRPSRKASARTSVAAVGMWTSGMPLLFALFLMPFFFWYFNVNELRSFEPGSSL